MSKNKKKACLKPRVSLSRVTWILLLFLITSCEPNPDQDKPLRTDYSLTNEKCLKPFESLSQNDRLNLYRVDCLQNQRLRIKTQDSGKEGTSITNAKKLTIIDDHIKIKVSEDKTVIINNLPLPDYYKICEEDVICDEGQKKHSFWPLLKGILPKTDPIQINSKFYGALDTEYEIVSKVYSNYLVLFKASENLEDIPYVEQTSLVKVNTDLEPTTKDDETFLYMVPFAGYRIRHCRLNVVLDEFKQETGGKSLDCENNRPGEDYIKISPQVVYYEYFRDTKKDFFPVKYFSGAKDPRHPTEGEWFSVKGVLKVANPDTIDLKEVSDSALLSFRLEPNLLKPVSFSREVIETIPEEFASQKISHAEFTMDLSGNRFNSFGEKKEENEFSTKRPWIIFNTSDQSLNTRTQEMTIAKDFFSMTQPEQEGGTIVQTGYIRKNYVIDETKKPFIPKRWFIDQHERVFGFGGVSQNKEEFGIDHNTKTELNKTARMLRFYTEEEENEIEFYFSEHSNHNKFFRDIAYNAIQVWNEAFAFITKGLNKRINLKLYDHEEDKKFKDVRYNFFNILYYDVNAPHDAYYYRPSFKSEKTGQMISTTVNLYIHDILNAHRYSIKHYIRYEIFKRESHYKEILKSYMDKIKGHILYDIWQKNTLPEHRYQIVSPTFKEEINERCDEVESFITKHQQTTRSPEELLEEKDSQFIISSCAKRFSDDEHILNRYTREKITKFCPDVTDFIATAKKEGYLPDQGFGQRKEEEENISEQCLLVVYREFLLNQTLKNIGYAFGLADNFKASFDEANYYTYEEIKERFPKTTKQLFPTKSDLIEVPKNASIMDPIPEDMPQLQVLGKYDLAALKYLYLDTVEVKDSEGKVTDLKLSIDPDPMKQKTIEEAVEEFDEVTLNRYLYCPSLVFKRSKEQDVADNDLLFCEIFDYGSSFTEIVQNRIESLRNQDNRFMYRYELAAVYPKDLRAKKVFSSFKAYTGYFSGLLIDQLTHQGLPNLINYSWDDSYSSSVQKAINQSLASPIHPSYEDLLSARDKILDFIVDTEFFETAMTCEMKRCQDKPCYDNTPLEKKSYFVNLNHSIHVLKSKSDDALFIEDCFSDDIKNFFQNEGYRIVGQEGMEDFITYEGDILATAKPKFDILKYSNLYNGNFVYSFLINPPQSLEKAGKNPPQLESVDFNVMFPSTDPVWLKRFQDKIVDIISHITSEESPGRSALDAHKIVRLYRNLVSSSITSYTSFTEQNLTNLRITQHTLGQEESLLNSFNKLMQIATISGDENLTPFLAKEYRTWINSLNPSGFDELQQQFDPLFNIESSKEIQGSFQQHLFALADDEDSFVLLTPKAIYFPYSADPDSLGAQIIKAMKITEKKIIYFEGKKELSPLEIIEKEKWISNGYLLSNLIQVSFP